MPRLAVRSVLATLLLVVSLSPYRPAASAPVEQDPDPNSLVQALVAQAGGDLRIGHHRGTGLVNFIGGTASQPAFLAPAGAAAQTAEAGAQAFLASYGSLFGLTDPAQQLTVMRDRGLDDGRSFVRFQQQHNGIPILAGELIVGMDGAKNVVSASGEALGAANLAVTTQPVLDAAAAQQIAVDRIAAVHGVPAADLQTTPPELWLYNPVLLRSDQPNYTQLVWRMDVAPTYLSHIRELVLVDAEAGKIALHFNQVDTAMNRLTYTANNTTSLPGTLLCNQAETNCNGDLHAQKAHLHAQQTYNFYANVHTRDSIDGAGLNLISTVRYGSSYVNAFWEGAQMVYGDGAGFPLADDVVAHELTHGVTQYESGLFYYYQSGAINESFSDLWGEFLDLTNGTGSDSAPKRWLMGEDVTGLGALRDMEDPTSKGDPDKMTSPHYYLGDGDYPNNDNGGVHTNSGLNNKAAFLMADGGTFNGFTVSALGITDTAKLYYEAQTNLLWSGADYLDLYNALNEACNNLDALNVLDPADCVEVQKATNAVEMNLQPISGYNLEASLCPSGDPLSVLYSSDLEGSPTGFTTGAISGSNRWSLFDEYAHSGVQAYLGNDSPAAVSDSYVALDPSLGNLPADAYLRFYHAYGFEQPNYDGGVLEYSTNGGSNWLDAGSLMEGNGYDGLIASANPLPDGRNGFIGDSHGYIATRVNLTSLAGQPAIFRWRMGTDSSLIDQGWWIDDISIHTCSAVSVEKLFLPLVTRGVSAGTWTTLMQEGFEGTFPNSLWYVTDPGFEEYYWAKRNCRAHSGSHSAWAMGGGSLGASLGCNANYVNNAFSWMIYGPIDLSDATAADFSYRLWQNAESTYDYTCALASTNGTNFFGTCLSGSTGGNWILRTLNLANVSGLGDLRGQPKVWIAVLFESDFIYTFSHGASVDGLRVRKCVGGVCAAASSAEAEPAGTEFVEVPAERNLAAPNDGRD